MGLALRFARQVERHALLAPGDRVVVALSGGVDSLTLLHLLRFAPHRPEVELVAAHFDHGMRAGSGEDALWVRGVCRAWAVPLREGRAESPPRSEEEAREGRYAFLFRVLAEEGARWLLTGHQADDQAETVLFRILRGTGLGGLGGIPLHRPPGIYRPLLPFSREEILLYAKDRRLRPREDPSNLDTRFPRNFLRHRVLPEVDESVAPGARAALRRLARLARENEEGWRSLLPSLLEGVLEEKDDGLLVVRSALLAYHPAVQARILREVLRRRGIGLQEAGTRAVMEFTRTGASGRSFPLPGGVGLRRGFDHFLLEEALEAEADHPLDVPDRGPGEGEAMLGGWGLGVEWGPKAPEGYRDLFSASSGDLEFPLRLRGWRPGDRMVLGYGTKKVKKLLAEARIPAVERPRTPVLCDARGRVLWVAGVATSALARCGEDQRSFFLGIRDALQR